MCKKRGQISSFIVLGLVFLILIGLIYYLKSMGATGIDLTEDSSLELASKSMEDYVESCLSEISLEAINYVSIHGGYYDLTEVFATSDPVFNTAYYFFLDENIMPSKETVELEIAKYIDDKLSVCLQDFESFTNQGFWVEEGMPESVVILNDEPVDSVTIELFLPLTLVKDSEQKQLDEFSVELTDVALKRMLDSAYSLTEHQVNDPTSLCLSCVHYEAVENSFTVDMIDIDDDSIVFGIHENATEYTLTLVYANRYIAYSCDNPPPDADAYFYVDCIEEQKETLGYVFGVESIENMNVSVGEELFYQIEYIGMNVTFEDYTELFDVNAETGEFEFIPEEEDIGYHTIWIKASDIFNNEEYESFNLEVSE